MTSSVKRKYEELYLALKSKAYLLSRAGQEIKILSGVPVTKCRHHAASRHVAPAGGDELDNALSFEGQQFCVLGH